MPAKGVKMSEEVRDKIRQSVRVVAILKRLEAHVLGRTKMKATQVNAARILLAKALPDLKAEEDIIADIKNRAKVSATPEISVSEWQQAQREWHTAEVEVKPEFVEPDPEYVEEEQWQEQQESSGDPIPDPKPLSSIAQ